MIALRTQATVCSSARICRGVIRSSRAAARASTSLALALAVSLWRAFLASALRCLITSASLIRRNDSRAL
jgi:hypothetical protein